MFSDFKKTRDTLILKLDLRNFHLGIILLEYVHGRINYN